MRNKLVFPNGGTENKYVWDRYSLTNEGQHTWDKNEVVESTVYKLHNREYEVLSLHHPNKHITTTIKKLK